MTKARKASAARKAPAARGELAEFQRALASTLMKPLAAGETIQRSSREVAERFVKPNDRLAAHERLQIYNQQYWWRLLSAFREDFRGLLAVLGERKFDRLAVAYLTACGSTSWNLRDLGQALESFVQQHPELVAPHGPLALEMIRMEWARVIAFDGPEQPPIDPAKLRGDPQQLRFALQPYLTLLQLQYPVDQLLGRLRQRSIETGSVSNAVSSARRRRPIRLAARPSATPICIAIHRVDLSVFYKRLDPAAYQLLLALRTGTPLAEACAVAFPDPPPDAAAKIQSWFATWTRFGWLVKRGR